MGRRNLKGYRCFSWAHEGSSPNSEQMVLDELSLCDIEMVLFLSTPPVDSLFHSWDRKIWLSQLVWQILSRCEGPDAWWPRKGSSHRGPQWNIRLPHQRRRIPRWVRAWLCQELERGEVAWMTETGFEQSNFCVHKSGVLSHPTVTLLWNILTRLTGPLELRKTTSLPS